MTSTAQARRNMVDCQLRTFDVTDRALLDAMEDLPREEFAPPGREALAYLDQNLALPGEGAGRDHRVMLAPMVLARLVQALRVDRGLRILDVAGGFGYAAALMTGLGAKVTMLESRPDLAAGARERLARLGFDVAVVDGPLQAGDPSGASFDAILIEGAIEERPSALLGQLTDGGRLACLTAEGRSCRGTLHVRSDAGFGFRTLFDASAPVLESFRPAPAFVF